MNKPARKVEWVVWGTLGLTLVAIAIAFVISEIEKGNAPVLPVITQQFPEFVLTNQFNQAVTLSNLLGQPWVADIIFTSCGGPCPEMTRRMSDLQSALPSNSSVKLVTLTTHPEFDTSEVLKRYSERFHAQNGRWIFLTGGKQEIVRVAVDGLKLVALEKDPAKRESANDLFIHSTLFVVVDRHGRLRGSFESAEPGMQKQILAALRALQREK